MLGRKDRRLDPRTLQFATYLRPRELAKLPPCPKTITAYAKAVELLGGWGMYKNDEYGDCTFATAGNVIKLWRDNAGKPKDPTDRQILKGYWATGKEDDGRVELDVLNYWRKTGIAGKKIHAYVSIKPNRLDQMKLAIWLFGSVYAGINLPLTAQAQFANGKNWAVGRGANAAPGSWGGHAVPYVGFNSKGVWCVTWKRLQFITNNFLLTYCDEMYVPLSPDWTSAPSGKAPSGYSFERLDADLALL